MNVPCPLHGSQLWITVLRPPPLSTLPTTSSTCSYPYLGSSRESGISRGTNIHTNRLLAALFLVWASNHPPGQPPTDVSMDATSIITQVSADDEQLNVQNEKGKSNMKVTPEKLNGRHFKRVLFRMGNWTIFFQRVKFSQGVFN